MNKRLDEIKNKYLGTYLLKENRNEDLLYLLSLAEVAERMAKDLEFFKDIYEGGSIIQSENHAALFEEHFDGLAEWEKAKSE